MAIIKSIVNGELVASISINDRGLNYGDGLFETIALVNHTPVFWQQHYQRLVKGGEVLGIGIPSENELRVNIQKLYENENIYDNYVVKIIITRGEGERGYRVQEDVSPNVVLQLSTYPAYKLEFWSSGVSLKLCDTQLAEQKLLAGIKHLNRLEQVLARREWGNEYQEGLMSDISANIIEGVMSNLFIVNEGVVITPLLSKAGVSGIMRGIILDICEEEGIPVRQDIVTLESLEKAQEIFLTNSLIGIWPVKNIEDNVYPMGNITKNIIQLLIKKHSVDYGSLGL